MKSTNKQCQKRPGKKFFGGISTVFEKKYFFLKKSCTATNYSDTIVMHSYTNARDGIHDLPSTNQRNGSKMAIVIVATKINLTKLKA